MAGDLLHYGTEAWPVLLIMEKNVQKVHVPSCRGRRFSFVSKHTVQVADGSSVHQHIGLGTALLLLSVFWCLGVFPDSRNRTRLARLVAQRWPERVLQRRFLVPRSVKRVLNPGGAA